MKVSAENYNKIKTNVVRFIKNNDIKDVTLGNINYLHNAFCRIIREPNNINSINLQKNYIVDLDTDYFDNFNLNDDSLHDSHLDTVFNKILKELK